MVFYALHLQKDHFTLFLDNEMYVSVGGTHFSSCSVMVLIAAHANYSSSMNSQPTAAAAAAARIVKMYNCLYEYFPPK